MAPNFTFLKTVSANVSPMKLHLNSLSPPCRAVMLCAKQLGVNLEYNEIDIVNGEQMRPEFLKLNPRHLVPVLEDEDLVLCESRAIIQYLANKYAKDDSFYPKDPKARALVDEMLYFDTSLVASVMDYYLRAMWYEGPLDRSKLDTVKEYFDYLNGMIGCKNWAAGTQMTLADFSLVSIVSLVEAFGLRMSNYSNINRWLENCRTNMMDYEALNGAHVKRYGDLLREKLGEIFKD